MITPNNTAGMFAGEPTLERLRSVGLLYDPHIWAIAAQVTILPMNRLADEGGKPTPELLAQAALIYSDRGGEIAAPATFIADAILRIVRQHHEKPAKLMEFWLPAYETGESGTQVIAGLFKTCDCTTLPCEHMIATQKQTDTAIGAALAAELNENGLCACDALPYLHAPEWHNKPLAPLDAAEIDATQVDAETSTSEDERSSASD